MKRTLLATAFALFLIWMPHRAFAQTKVIYLTSGTSWTVPSDWNSSNNTIEVIGSGGYTKASDTILGGSGGGSYSRISNLSLSPNAQVSYQIGTSGQAVTTGAATWFNGTSISNASVSAEGGCAGGTGGCANSITSNIGQVIYKGGNGAATASCGQYINCGGGGGGAAGPHGAGNNGKLYVSSCAVGGIGDAGFGGAGGATSGTICSPGSAGAEYTTSTGSSAGSGGGGAGALGVVVGSYSCTPGGGYGGGAGGCYTTSSVLGGSGLIVITYAPNPSLYVANVGFLQLATLPVTAYPLNSSGNTLPLPSATPTPETGLAGPLGVARDSGGNLYVANNYVDSVTIYAAGANGDAAPTATIAGSNTGLINPTGVAVDSARNIYVANVASQPTGYDSITIFAAGSNGNIAPTATISGAATGLAFPTGIALDSSGRIYVANAGSQLGGTDSITIYPAGSSGNVTPSTTISGSSTALQLPQGIALDSHGNIYVANDGSQAGGEDSVTVYSAGSNGNAAPTATISGSNTKLDVPGGIAVDSAGNIYITNDGAVYSNGLSPDSITVYPAGSSGNVTPSNSLLALGLMSPAGITVDSNGNLYVVDDGSNENSVDAITVYPTNSLIPSETLGLDTALEVPTGIALDMSGNIYVANSGSAAFESDSINVYAPGTYGNSPISWAIAGSNTGLAQPGGIALDLHGNIYAANTVGGIDGLGSLTVYPAGSSGNAAPTVTIAGNSSGDNTGFDYPTGVALDANGYVYVANEYGGPDGAGSITIYSPGSTGNAAPIATIGDDPSCAPCDNTNLNSPSGVAIDFSGNIYVVNSSGGPAGLGSITVYPSLGTSSGTLNESPSVMLQGASLTSDSTGFNIASGIALDSLGNIYVTNEGSLAGGSDTITIYPAGSNGNVAPTRAIAGSSTGLNAPQGIAVTWNAGSLGGNEPATELPRRKRRKDRR